MRALVVLGLAGLALAGCGAEERDPKQTLGEAAAATAKEDSSRFAATVDLGEQGKAVAEGLFDYATERGRVQIDYSALRGEEFEEGTNGPVEIRFPGADVVYVKGVPGLSAPRAKPWTKDSLDGESVFEDFGGSPVQILRTVERALTDVEVVGEDDVRGAEATHYRGTLALERLPRARGDDEGLREFFREYGATSMLEVDLWVDDDGMIRRARSDIGGRDGFVLTLELYDFGVEVDVEPPPAELVLTAPYSDEEGEDE